MYITENKPLASTFTGGWAIKTATFKEIRKKAITQLPPEEPAELAHELISSLDEKQNSFDSEDAWDLEIKRRVDEIKSGKTSGRPAENVLAEIRAHYS